VEYVDDWNSESEFVSQWNMDKRIVANNQINVVKKIVRNSVPKYTVVFRNWSIFFMPVPCTFGYNRKEIVSSFTQAGLVAFVGYECENVERLTLLALGLSDYS
jgi:hypothetical protein